MAAVRSLIVALLAIFVVTLARLATVNMLLLVGVARKGNSGVATYPRKIYSQHCRYFDCS